MGKGDIANVRKIADEERSALPELKTDFDHGQQQHAQPEPG